MKGRFVWLTVILVILSTAMTVYATDFRTLLGVDNKASTPTHLAWQIEVVDNGIGQGGGAEVSLALDGTETPHVSYADWSDGVDTRLRYARRSVGGWITQTVPFAGSMQGVDSSLAVDSGNSPHIAHPNGNEDLLYRWWSGTQWNISTVGWGPHFGSDPSLALNSSNIPHISFYTGWPEYHGLRYAYRTGSNWDIQTVDAGDTGKGNSLALDALGNPHISYCGLNSGSIRYAVWTGAAWSVSTVTEITNGSCEKTSLALDSTDSPHIGYAVRLGPTDYEVRYAWWTGSNWEIHLVDQRGGQGVSMALDSSNVPRLSYFDETTGDLLYSYKGGSAWYRQLIDNGPGVAYYLDTSVAVGESGVHFAYYMPTGPYPAPIELRYALLPLQFSTIIGPAGGSLTSTTDHTFYLFPSGTFTDTVIVTHTVHRLGSVALPGSNLTGIGHEFEVTAVYSATGQPAQLAPGQTYTLTVHYTEAEKGPAIENTLAFYWWDGNQWVKEPSSTVDTANNTVTAMPDHLSLWGVLGQTWRVYLPIVVRNF